MAKPLRPRALRRAQQRTVKNLGERLDKLGDAAPGGGPLRPMVVPSSPAAEARVRATPCPRCGKGQMPKDQTAEMHAGRPLLVVWSRCDGCGRARRTWFVVAASRN